MLLLLTGHAEFTGLKGLAACEVYAILLSLSAFMPSSIIVQGIPQVEKSCEVRKAGI